MSSRGGVQGRTRWAGLALLALLPVAAALAGCKGGPERVELPRQQMLARHGKGYWRDVLDRGHDAWLSLEADCDVTISNPQISTASKAVRLTGGRLIVLKPDLVYLRVPDSDDPGLRLVGDGETYRADVGVFRDAYSGPYDDPVVFQQGRIHIMPADIAHAFCPAALLDDRGLVLNEWERTSRLSSIQWIEEPPVLRMTSAIELDRMSESITVIEKYDDEGGIRAGITYQRSASVEAALGRSARVPTMVLISYPAEQTRILLSLENVKLNQPVEAENPFVAAQ